MLGADRTFLTFTVCLLAVAVLSTGACRETRTAVVGVAASGNFLTAARLAVGDALSAEPLPGFDTLMVREGNNLSGPAIEAADSMVGIPGIVAVIGHSNSAASLAASQIYNTHRVVQLAPTSTAVLYSSAGPYSFRLVPPDDRQGAFIAETLAQEYPEGAGIALLFVNDDYGRGLRTALLERLDSDHFPVLLDLPHNETAFGPTEVQHAVSALVAAEPQVVVWLARGQVLDRFLPALRTSAGGIPVLGSDAVASAAATSASAAYWEGVRYVEFLDLDGTEALREFRARYRERSGAPALGPEVLTYDAMRLLIEGIREGARSGEAMREYLTSLGRVRPAYQGVSGPISFDESGNVERSYALNTPFPGNGR